ncbi:MAG: hypothetical protein P8R42_23085 [Candidatus Binatia bacterium]|nr:hypothetical protein [Candidatus Binatia bacterium]
MLASILLVLTFNAAPARGAAGDLDMTFGTGGRVTTPISGGADAVVLQPDAKIVAAGFAVPGSSGVDFGLVRYESDGNLDTSFGVGGVVTTDFGGSDFGNAVARQPDGKILVCGSDTNSQLPLARYMPDGSLDATFGVGGKVLSGVVGGSCNDVAVQADGKILTAGAHLARFESDGSLDTSFGVGGVVDSPFGVIPGPARGMALQADGKIVAVGYTNSSFPPDFDFTVSRHASDGSLDTTFGTSGVVTTDFAGPQNYARAVAIQPDGKILVGGSEADDVTYDYDFALVRYESDGGLDASFGAGGIVITESTDSGNDDDVGIYSLALQPDGKIVAAGYTYTGSSLIYDSDAYDMTVVRYESDGSEDATFGVGGVATADFGNSDDEGYAVALQSDGKIVVAGQAYLGGGSSGQNFAVARFEADSAPPPGWPSVTAAAVAVITPLLSDPTTPRLAANSLRSAKNQLESALSQFNRGKIRAAMNSLKKAVGNLEKAIRKGLDPATVNATIGDLAAFSRQQASDEIAAAIARGGQASKIAVAQNWLADGDTKTDLSEACTRYVKAFSKAKQA